MLQKSKIKKSFVHEIEIVYSKQTPFENIFLKSSDDSYKFLMSIYDMRKIDYKEFFYVILLNRRNQVIGYSQIGVGSTTGVEVNVKEIFQLAIMSNATEIILSHNHPSGNVAVSTEDMKITQKIKSGCQFFDINVLDHVIVTSISYYSFADNGIL